MHRNTQAGRITGVFALLLIISTFSSASAQFPGPFGGGRLLPPPPLAPWRNMNQPAAQPTQAPATQAQPTAAAQPAAAQSTQAQSAQPTEAQPATAPATQNAEEPTAKVTEADPYVKTPVPETPANADASVALENPATAETAAASDVPASESKQPTEGEVVQKSLKVAIPAEALKPAETAEKKPDLQKSDLRPEVLQTIEQINTQEENQPVAMPLLQGLRLTVKEILALNEALARFLTPQEFAAVQGLNNYRARCGLFPCLIDLSLCNAARYHSSNMQSRGFFDHVSPWGENFLMRAARYGTSASAENIFMGSSSGMAANNAWINSSGHRANMVGPYQRVGVGNAGGFFTQVFGR